MTPAVRETPHPSALRADTFSRRGRRVRDNLSIRSGEDRADNLLSVVLDLLIGEPQHPEPLPSKPVVTRRIFRAILLLGAISLDDQPVPEADEIRDIAPENDLASELQARQPPIPEEFP